jgi:hypothetical protein
MVPTVLVFVIAEAAVGEGGVIETLKASTRI